MRRTSGPRRGRLAGGVFAPWPHLVRPGKVRRATLKGGAFAAWPHTRRPAVALTPEDLDEAVARAEQGLDLLPHMPDVEVEACEFCGRADWEAPGECLARVRASSGALAHLAFILEALPLPGERAPSRREAEITTLAHDALELLEDMGFTAEGYRRRQAERRAKR